VTTNPCGEVLLYPNEPCNLGSINVWAFARQDDDGNTFVDWDALKTAVRSCTRFLDNVIDVNNFPLKAIEEMSLATRKIGLGVMGVGDLLYELRIPYNTEEGRKFMEQLMEFIAYWSKIESIELAKTRGNLPYYDKSFYKEGRLPIKGPEQKDKRHFDWDRLGQEIKRNGIRNGYTTIIAPTGSISMIAGCSSGMEPVYSLVYEKNVKVGSFFYVDPAAEKVLREEGLLNERLMEDINEHKGSIQSIGYVPDSIRKALVTANDITPEDHIKALASFQKWVDSSISKTNNFPADATTEYMRESYLLAYRLGCKGVTVFRDSSIKDQVLVAPKSKEEKKETMEVDIKPEMKKIIKESESGLVFAGNSNGDVAKPMTKAAIRNCPECGTKVELKEGCLHCPGCGWGLCI
jgi:ribonucleoside-diphosphate reductase alpha chain